MHDLRVVCLVDWRLEVFLFSIKQKMPGCDVLHRHPNIYFRAFFHCYKISNSSEDTNNKNILKRILLHRLLWILFFQFSCVYEYDTMIEILEYTKQNTQQLKPTEIR